MIDVVSLTVAFSSAEAANEFIKTKQLENYNLASTKVFEDDPVYLTIYDSKIVDKIKF